ncbi:DNA replication terminus site-binding protein [Pseudomonas sp. NPDC089569]|uniref:DNA replication terminus site-binding protein n=1 Tax=Pseudomonas sp. NPDC089569 TaxID=3390722 RepID=UPI003D078955
MTNYLSNASGALQLVNELREELEALELVLEASSTHIRVDAIFGIELRKTKLVTVGNPIPVTPLFGAAALQCAKDVLTNITLKPEQSAKETFRAPGALGLPRVAIQYLEKTNRIRLELFRLLGLLKAHERKALWKKFPGISSLQAIRTTVILSDPQFIRFYWHVGSSGVKRQAKDLIAEWDKQLFDLHGYRPRMDDTLENSLERKLVYSLEMLEALDDTSEQVCIHRPVAPHVRARFKDGDNEPDFVLAQTPFVYDIESPPPRIDPLVSYDPSGAKAASQENQGRSTRARLEEEPYIEAMHIYQYKEGYRTFGPVEKTPKKRNKRVPISE